MQIRCYCSGEQYDALQLIYIHTHLESAHFNIYSLFNFPQPLYRTKYLSIVYSKYQNLKILYLFDSLTFKFFLKTHPSIRYKILSFQNSNLYLIDILNLVETC